MENIENLSPLVLAYVGDAVFELMVRTHLARQGPAKVESLHREALHYVSAAGQAKLVVNLEGYLTPKEKDILRRGRNVRPGHMPRNVDRAEYHLSTSLESLFGYLHLKGEWTRLNELTRLVFRI